MSDERWTPVKMEWDKDVGVVGRLNTAVTAMYAAESDEALVAVRDETKSDLGVLTGEGRRKFEAAYAANVLRLVRPDLLRPHEVYVVTTTKKMPGGEFEFPDTTVYDTFEAAVRTTVANLILVGDLYVNMAKPDLTDLKTAVEAGDWAAVYGVLVKRLRRVVVRIKATAIGQDDRALTFKVSPESAVGPSVWPSVKVKNSTIETRFGAGGKGLSGSYLVAEVTELAAMLGAYGAMSDKAVADTLVRIAHIVGDSETANDQKAVDLWNERAGEVCDEGEHEEDVE